MHIKAKLVVCSSLEILWDPFSHSHDIGPHAAFCSTQVTVLDLVPLNLQHRYAQVRDIFWNEVAPPRVRRVGRDVCGRGELEEGRRPGLGFKVGPGFSKRSPMESRA